MNSFSAQRFLLPFNRPIRALCLFVLSILAGLTAAAQSNSDLYRGTWQIQTPENGGLTILIKSNGRAAYFWSENTDRSVHQGTWTVEDEAAILTWDDHSSHRMEREALGFKVAFSDANSVEKYSARAEQIPKEVLGQWAKPPTQADELRSERDQAKGFFGTWKLGQGQYLFIEEDRSAASTDEDESIGLRGAWARQGSELHIAWDSGHYSILRENERGFAYKQIEPGALIEEDKTTFLAAARTITDNVPAEWLSAYQAERAAHSGSIAFANRKSARDFYRGSWIIRRSAAAYERIEIGRFGGLDSNRKQQLTGTWRMDGQDIFMRWDDGMRSILNPLGQGFLLYEYAPGRPLDGVPTRIFPAAPTDASKLEEHLKDRQVVASKVLELAKTAGVNLSSNDAGWGRTFARWAWPFGEDEVGNNTLETLEEATGSGSQDPWWWPFWSENSDSDSSSSDSAAASDTPAATTSAQPSQPAKSSKKVWYWPF
jgi:hypothetical protein